MPFFISAILFSLKLQAQEMKAAWLVRHNWQSSAHVDSVLALAAQNKISDIFIQIRGRGDAYYINSFEPFGRDFNSDNDLLTLFIEKARYLNIRTHGWINVLLVGSDRNSPFPENHVLQLHPDWVLIDSKGKSLLDYSYESYASVALEGIYLNPLIPDVLDYHIKLIEHIIKNYPFDGIHLDYLRLPSPPFYGGSVTRVDSVTSVLDQFVKNAQKVIRRHRVNGLVTIAVKSNIQSARLEYGQDWPLWLKNNYIDYAVMMNYTRNDNRFIRHLEPIPPDLRKRVIVGVSIYDKPLSQAMHQIEKATEKGFNKFNC